MDKDPIEIWFFNPSLVFIGLAEDCEATRYRQRWNTYGDFEFYLYRMIPQVQIDNLVVFGHDGRKSGIIKYIKVEKTGRVRVKGYSLLWLLTKRVTVPPAGKGYFTAQGSQEAVIRALVENNAIHPENPRRAIAYLVLGATASGKSTGAGDVVAFQSRYAELDMEVSSLSQSSGLGVSIDFDYREAILVFRVREGVDRSCEQEERTPVVFCEEYDTIVSRTYEINDIDTKSCAYTAGQGEEADREIYILGDDLSLNERSEVFIDARDIADTWLLPDRAMTKIANMKRAEAYECMVSGEGYLTKWDIGDYVTVLDRGLGIKKKLQVTAVEESVDSKGVYEVEATIGEAPKSIADQLRSKTSALQNTM